MKNFIQCMLIRAIRTFCQALVAEIGTGAIGLLALDWPQMLSIAGTAAILSMLTSVATGLPEVEA